MHCIIMCSILAVIVWLDISLGVFAEVHGGTFLALAGKDSVVLATDSRFSSVSTGGMFLGSFPRPIIRIGSKTLIGCFGLESDTRLLADLLHGRLVGHFDEEIGTAAISQLISDILYESPLLLQPIVVGLRDSTRYGPAEIAGGVHEGEHDLIPVMCTMDQLGAMTLSESFAVTGTARAGLMAVCESLYVPNLDPHGLVGLAERCLKLAVQRDVLSGSDMRIFTITRNCIYVKDIKMNDV